MRSERKRLRFHRTPALFTWLYPSLTWRVPTERKEVFLTFDDGPVAGPTDFVLELLMAQHIKATFFCIGDNIRKFPAVFGRIRSDGHNIGNHTFNHVNGWKVSAGDYLSNVRLCQTELRSTAGGTLLFRPPYGRITPSQVRLLNEYQIVMWDVLTYDYSGSISPEACLRGSLSAVRPGSIVVFHDSKKAERNLMHALPRFIEGCRSRGYEFKTLA